MTEPAHYNWNDFQRSPAPDESGDVAAEPTATDIDDLRAAWNEIHPVETLDEAVNDSVRYNWNDRHKQRDAPRAPGPTAPPPTEIGAYGRTALEREVEAMAAAPQGTRNHQLNRSAFNLAQLVAAGHLTEYLVEDHLRAAAAQAGLGAAEIEATLRSGLRAGSQSPRDVQPLTLPPQVQEVDAAQLARPGTDARTQTGIDTVRYAFRPGGDFILDTPADPAPLWGTGDQVLLADGEALIIAGSQGLGKTTIAQQLALGRAGFPGHDTLLDYPITPGQGRVLYLAMDRPRQAARSFRRMVTEDARDLLNDRLRVWQGPPPQDLAQLPALLLQLCEEAGADTVIVDSLKDAAIGLNDDAVGAGYNRARQTAIAGGVQVVELHHNRKAINGSKAEHPTIDDLYGSTWLPSGAGSVLLLSGAPGDPIVGVHHIKQPASEVGPLKVLHDHTLGRTTVFHSTDLVLLAGQPNGITAVDAARALFDTAKPTANEKEKARRKLTSLTSSGLLQVFDVGDKATNRPARWTA